MSFIKKTASTFGTQIVLITLGMATGIITARVLGPHLKGQAALLTMITELLFMVCSLGLGSAFAYFVAKKQFPYRHILTLALASAILFGAGGAAIFYLSWPIHSSVWAGLPPHLVFFAVLLGIICIYINYLTRILVGFGRIYLMNFAGFIRSFSTFLGVVLLLLIWNYGLGGLMVVFWAAALSQLFVLLYGLRKNLFPAIFFGGGLFRASFSYGIKSHALLLINFLNYRIDLLLLGHYTDAASVGFYSLAVSMAELMWMVPNSAVAPLFSSVASSDSDDRSLLTLLTVRWTLIILVFLAIGGVVAGQPFLALLYGVDFLPSYAPFLWLLPGVCLLPIFKLLIIDLAARGYPGYGTATSAVALVVNISFNVLLIPQMGMSGAALATSISYSIMSFLSLVFFIRVTGYGLKDIFVIKKEEIISVVNYLRNFLKSQKG